MRITSFFQKNSIGFASILLVLFAFAALFTPLIIIVNLYETHFPVLVYFFGVNLVLVEIGILLLVFWLLYQRTININNDRKMIEKMIESDHKKDFQEILNIDAAGRREFERERNKINDLFRLIELAKETTETSESEPTTDKSDKLLVRVIHKNVTIEITKLNQLIAHYNSLNIQPKTEKHV